MITSALVALAAAPAFGATVTRAPTISGKAVRGSEMTASTGDWAPAGAKAGDDWLRCNASGAGCRPISGSCDRRYTVRDPDVGYTLRVRLTVTELGQLRASDVSGPTAVIAEDLYAESTVDSGGICVNLTSTGPGQGAVKLVRVRALRRSYRPRATIEIRVTQPKKIGKYTRVKTRRGKAPLRVDRCLMSGSTRPVRCPTG